MAQVVQRDVTPYMHGHLCVVLCLLSLFTYLLFSLFCRSSSSPSRRPSPLSTRVHVSEPAQLPLGDRGSVMTTRHPAQVMSPTRRRTSWTRKSLTSRLPATSTGSIPFDDTSRNDPDVDDDQLAMYLAGAVDSTGQPVAKRSEIGRFSWDTRNLKSAQKQFS